MPTDEIYAAMSRGLTVAPSPAPKPAPAAEPAIDTTNPKTLASVILWAASESGRGTPAGDALMAERKNRADLIGKQQAREQAARSGVALTPAMLEGYITGARHSHGLPSPEEESQELLIDSARNEDINAVQHGARNFGLMVLPGLLQSAPGRSMDSEELDTLALARQGQAAKHDTFTPTEKAISGTTEMVGNVASMVIPGGAPARTASLMSTQFVPIAHEGIQAGMDPGEAIGGAAAKTAIMELTGGMRVPGLTAAPLTRGAVKAGGRQAVRAFAEGTARDVMAGATKGALMDAGVQTVDKTIHAIDPTAPEAQDNMASSAGAFGAMDAVMGAITRGHRGVTIGKALRQERNVAQDQLAGHMPNPEVAQMWANQPANAAALPIRGKAGETAAVQQAQAREQQAGNRPEADQLELLRMQEEPEAAMQTPLTEQEIAGISEAKRRQEDATLTQEARLRLQKGDEARDTRLATAAELLREEQQINAPKAPEPEAPVEMNQPAPSVGADPAVQAAKGRLLSMRSGLSERGGMERYQAAKRDLDAALKAAEARVADTEPAPVPVPEATHRAEVSRIVREYGAGRMTPEQATAARKTADETLTKSKEPTNARPPAVPEKIQGVREGLPQARIEGVAREGKVGAQERQVEGRRAEEPVAARSDEVPEPPIDARSERTAAVASGTLPDKTIHADMKAAGATNAARIDAQQAPEAAGPKRKVFSPRNIGSAVQRVLAQFRRAFGGFQGNKAKGLPMMSEVTQRTMSPEARAKITHTEDLFAGSGSAGLMHRIVNFPSAGDHVIRDFNEARLEKVRMVQTMDPAQVRRRSKELGVERDVRAAILNRSSGGGMTGRVEKMLADMMDPDTGKVKDPATREYAALLHLYVDHIGRIGAETRKKQGKIYTPEELWSKLVSGVTEYSNDAYRLAQAAKAKGINIQYKHGDSFAADIPKGDNVHVLMDPPYFGTSGYNADDVVGAGTYRKVRDLFGRLRDNGNHAQYTDEAWWTRKLPGKAEWKDGTVVREGDKILGQIHDEADSFDTHRVGERVESIATIDPTKPRSARAEVPAREGEKPLAGTVSETVGETPTAAGTPEPTTPRAEGQEAKAIRAGLEGKSTTGDKLMVPSAPGKTQGVVPAIEGLKVTEREDGVIEVHTDAGHPVAPIRIQPAMNPKNVDPRAWFRSVSQEHDIGAELRRMKVNPAFAKDADTFAANVPREIQEKLFKKFKPRGGYDRESGEIVLHVQGDAENTIGRTGNHEIEHAYIDMFMPRADRDMLLQAMRDRKIPGADKLSADPTKEGYAEFLEAVRHLNERWSPERDIAAAARQKMLADSGVRGVINRFWSKLKAFFGVVDKAAAKTPDGVEVVLGRLRKGEYKTPVEKPKAPQGGEKASYSAERDAEPEIYGRVQKVAGVAHERAQALADEVIRLKNIKAERQSLDDAVQEGRRIIAEKYQGNAVDAAKDIMSAPGMRTVEQTAVIKQAMDEAAGRAGWSTTAAEFLVKSATDIYVNLHNAAKIMSHARNARGPTGALADLRQAVFAPSDATMDRINTIRTELGKTSLDAATRRNYEQQLESINARVAKSRQRLVTTLKEKYGIDLASASAENYAVDPQLAADVMSVIRHELRAKGSSKFIDFYRAGLLSDAITTQGQQLTGNISAAVFRSNPLAFGIREGSFASGKLAFMGWMSPKLYMTAVKNGIDSALGRGSREKASGEKLGAPRNIYVQETMDVELGRMDEPGASRDSHRGLIMAPMTAVSFRPMAFIDGSAQRFASGLHEADLYYKAVKEAGGSEAEAMKMAKGVLDGTVEVPHSMRVDAIIKSLDATYQDLAIADPKKQGAETDTRGIVGTGMRIVRAADHIIPVPMRVRDAETGKKKWAMEGEEGERSFVPLGSLKVPFVRTGVAIARAAIKATPSSAIPYMALRAGLGRYKGVDGKAEFRKDVSYLVMGGLVRAAITAGALGGLVSVTGNESDDARRKMMREGDLATGEYTLKVLGYDLPFQRVEPIATMVAAFGNAVNRYRKGENIVTASIKGDYEALLNLGAAMSWFHTLNNIRSIGDTSRFGGPQADWKDKLVQQLAAEPMSSMWPAFTRTFKTDTARRLFPEAEGIAHDPKKFAQYVLEKSGILKTPPMYNIEGKPQEQATPGMLGRFERGALGRKPKDLSSPFTLAFDKFREGLPEGDREEFTIPSFNDTFTWKGKHYQMTPEEFSEFQRVAGEEQSKGFASLAGPLGRIAPSAPVAKKIKARIDAVHRNAIDRAQRKILATRSKAGTLNRAGDY